MEDGTKSILQLLLVKRIIGGKHTPEKRVMGWIKHLSPDEQKNVKSEWEKCIKQDLWVFRMKKTGEWHISINPKMVPEIIKAIGVK